MRRKTVSGIMLTLLITSIVTVLSCKANLTSEIVAAYGSTPDIDGIITSGEWNDASYVTFNETTVFVKQDGVNLYVAFNVSDSTYSIGDECHVYLDVEHHESTSLQSDDRALVVKRNGGLVELKGSAGTWQWVPTISGWTANVNSTSTVWQAEYNITYSKINVTAGTAKTLGVELESFDYIPPYPGARYMWPYSADPDFDKKPNQWGDMTPNEYNWGQPPPPHHTLTIYSSPLGVTFTVDGVSRTTPWSRIYTENTSVSLIMPEIRTVGDARYYWDQWSDGNTSRSRTLTMDADITLTAQYAILDYQLTITSSPITGIQFTINGVPQTTPYTEWLLEGSYILEMPQTHNGYVWSHWLEDGDTNRIKTITLQGTTWTAVYEPAPKPVGGKATPINIPMNKPETPTLWIWLSTIILSLVVTVVYVKKRKKTYRD